MLSVTPPFGACQRFSALLRKRNIKQIEGDGASRFTTFFTDMALVTCFVWRATRHVCDGTLVELERQPKTIDTEAYLLPLVSAIHIHTALPDLRRQA